MNYTVSLKIHSKCNFPFHMLFSLLGIHPQCSSLFRFLFFQKIPMCLSRLSIEATSSRKPSSLRWASFSLFHGACAPFHHGTDGLSLSLNSELLPNKVDLDHAWTPRT